MADSPWPLIEVAVEPMCEADRPTLASSLARLSDNDPSLSVVTDSETGQTILGGLDEMHLDTAVGALKHGYGGVRIGRPQVAYRETSASRTEVDYTHKRFAGGVGQFARVKLVVEPTASNTGCAFESRIAGGTVPEEYIPAVETGLRSVLRAGILAGFPVVGVRIALIDGAYHEVESSALAFEIAARAGLREALQKGGSMLLEPVMTIEIAAPARCVGAIVADLRSRRGRIEAHDDRTIVHAEVPFATTLGYANSLRSVSRGEGRFAMRFARYEPVPLPGGDVPPAAPAAALRAEVR